MTDSEGSLNSLYQAAERLRTQLDSLQANSEQYQTRLQETINRYEQCKDLASKVSLFSANETLEDVSTADMQYLSIDYVLGDLIARAFTGNRAQLLKDSQTSYSQFLSRLDDYELLPKESKELYERFTESKDDFSLLPPNDPSARRNVKIARFQQEKDIKQKIQYINSDPRIQQDDEAIVRTLRLAELSLHTHQTFQALDMISQELKILSLAPPSSSGPRSDDVDNRESSRISNGQYSDRLDLGLASMLQGGKSGPILSKSGRPLQPFTLLDSRERLRNGVFKPGHNLPTMTIDEYLDEERRRGGIIEGGGEPPVVEPNEDDVDAADRDTMKAREWDEFVEANPKGSGNTLNRG